MSFELATYKVKDWVVLGRTSFPTPHKVSDELINEARIVRVIKGTSKLYSANQVINLTDGDTLIMKTDNFINNWLEIESLKKAIVVVFQLNSNLLQHLYNDELPVWFEESTPTVQESIVKVDSHIILDTYFSSLQSYLDSDDFLSEEVIQGKIKELISLLIKTDSSGETRKVFGNLFNATEYAFQDTISKNLFEDLNIEDLAFLTGMSASSFKRKFNDVFGTSPNKYITSKRLDKAQTLLKTTQLTISEIAYDCGFSNVGYFSKSFKKYYNISPSDLKKQV